ncbi:MAG: hypothetical protein RSA22_05635 [Acinetobacter sp.]|jgi:hypothetical protein
MLYSSIALAEMQDRFLTIETHDNFVSTGTYNSFKPTIPYKQKVRLISEIFAFPKEWNPVAESELNRQFLKYVMNNYLKEFNKLRLHQQGGITVGRNVIYSQINIDDYNRMSINPPEVKYPIDIVLIKGFKYVEPNKLDTIDIRTDPIFMKANEIILNKSPN